MPLPRFDAERVQRRLRGGSSSPVVVSTPAGTFVGKLRGAGQGALALISEIIVAELAVLLGLPVPERVLLDFPSELPSDDRNDELADLLHRSAGLNLGFRLLDGALEATPKRLEALPDDFVARVLFLDGLTQNPDRTPANPNILFWKGQPWLIDHGAALLFHHDWSSVTEQSPREPTSYAGHLFEQRSAVLAGHDDELAARLDRPTLETAIGNVPDELIAAASPGALAPRVRAAYHAFLWKRLRHPRPFVRDLSFRR